MASLNPSSIYTPTGHDGWRFYISLSVSSTSGNNVTIKYSITTDRNGSSSSYIQVSATSFSINVFLSFSKAKSLSAKAE